MKLFYRNILLALTLIMLLPHYSYSRAMVADVNPRKIDIDQNFKGTSLLVYGARNDAGNIVVVVRGPHEKQILRKKGRVLGVWTNVKNIELDDFYSYYAVASMRPLNTIQNEGLLKKLEVGTDNINIHEERYIRESKANKVKASAIKLMQAKNLYSKDPYQISFWGETLFRTFINFPKNISSGIYSIDIYLFSDGMLHSFQTLPVMVDKVGLEAFVNDIALKRPLLYGLMSVLMALTIGLIIGTLFSKK